MLLEVGSTIPTSISGLSASIHPKSSLANIPSTILTNNPYHSFPELACRSRAHPLVTPSLTYQLVIVHRSFYEHDKSPVTVVRNSIAPLNRLQDTCKYQTLQEADMSQYKSVSKRVDTQYKPQLVLLQFWLSKFFLGCQVVVISEHDKKLFKRNHPVSVDVSFFDKLLDCWHIFSEQFDKVLLF